MQFLELPDHVADDAERGAVTVEDRVEPLLLLGGVVGVGIAYLPQLMARTGLSTPSPEVATGEEPALARIAGNKLEDISIIGIAALRRRTRAEAHAIAGIAKLLHDERLAQVLADGEMTIDIVLSVGAGTWQVFDERVGLGPAPIVRPQMHIAVVDILVGADALIASIVTLAAPCALTADGDEVVLVDAANERRGLAEPPLKGRESLLREGTRLVADLPRHDGRIVDIAPMGVAVGAMEDEAHIVVEELMGFVVGSKLLHKVHVSGIAGFVGPRRFAESSLLEIVAVAPTPLPRVVEIEHGHHLALAHLLKQIVEPGEDRVVVYARRFLQCRLHLGFHAPPAVGAHEDAQVVDARSLQPVELTAEARTVAALTRRAKDRSIPQIGPDIIIRFAATPKFTVVALHILGLGRKG